MKTLLGLLILVSLVAMPVAAQNTGGGLNLPVVGSVTGDAVGTITGNFNLQRFALQNGQLVAIGTFTGTVRDASGNILRSVVAAVAAAVAQGPNQPSCQILDLNIGPINLDLLGLVVTTDPINLNITAQPGAGNLLGNLLCSVANLLNNPSQQLVSLLNNLLRVIGSL
jgi:hypothetical protein